MSPDILDGQGEPIPARKAATVRGLRWMAANWRVWVPIFISAIAILISGGSLLLSMGNSAVTRRLSKLDVRPTLRLNSYFFPIEGSPPRWSLTNVGPVEAVQVKVELIAHWYEPKWGDPLVSVKGSQETTRIAKIEPQEKKTCAFPKNWLDINAIQGRPPQNSVMEILVTYTRPQDLKKYSESAYYFIDPNGRWVSENSNRLRGEPYESMKAALLKVHRKAWPLYGEWPGDLLHPNE